MSTALSRLTKTTARFGAGCVVLGLMCACASAPTQSGVNDPLEPQNRAVHNFNRGVDSVVLRPTATAYGTVVPSPVRTGVSNVASNLGLPSIVLNDILQLQADDALKNTFRFLMNTTFGFGGLLDIATEAGLDEQNTDFGETLKVWGVGEGVYTELPLIGPSTARHFTGRVVDTVTNPVNLLVTGTDRAAVTTTSVVARFGDRYRYSDLIDSILYESEDSYGQARLLYLQNRRFQLNGAAEPEYFDPYEDIYGAE